MTRPPGNVFEWILPLLFSAAAGYVIWWFPRYIVWTGNASDALALRYAPAGMLDFAVLAALPVLFVAGMFTVRLATMEHVGTGGLDRFSLFVGRVTMMIVALIVLVMFYEVMLRYVLERPTLWANELSLWMAGFVFLFSGLYAMQQRCHIRIYILYDRMPRLGQKLADLVSTGLIVIFAIALVWGGFNEASDKVMRWETFGTAFDPPIPATLKPLVLLFVCLVALQAVSNLILDWNEPPQQHSVVDEFDLPPTLTKGH